MHITGPDRFAVKLIAAPGALLERRVAWHRLLFSIDGCWCPYLVLDAVPWRSYQLQCISSRVMIPRDVTS